jgi:DnaJ homolog subfamily C member 28
MLTLAHPPRVLSAYTLEDARNHRDQEWVTREHAYHTVALDELNALVRKFNGLAPYTVRRPYYIIQSELERAYRDASEDVLSGLAENARKAGVGRRPDIGRGLVDDDDGVGVGSGGSGGVDEPLRLWDAVTGWFRRRRPA